MSIYTFIISGNQEKADGNPIPYFRSTQGSFFNKGSRRYHAWKDYVRKAFFDAVKREMGAKEYRELEGRAMKDGKGKPIILSAGDKAIMEIDIMWRDRAHSDADNVFKGIADALFSNDKHISSGRFDTAYSSNRKGSVKVRIITTS